MSLIKYIERLQRMDSLISMKSTGTPDEFARKMRLRRSTLFQNLQELKEIGVEIKYSYIRQTYYYADGHRIKIELEDTDPDDKSDNGLKKKKKKLFPLRYK